MLNVDLVQGPSVYLASWVQMSTLPLAGGSDLTGWGNFDPLRMMGDALIFHGLYPIDEAMGFPTMNSKWMVQIEGQRPTRHRFFHGVDSYRFGAGIHPFPFPSLPKPVRENQVDHTTYGGSAIVSDTPINGFEKLGPNAPRWGELPPGVYASKTVFEGASQTLEGEYILALPQTLAGGFTNVSEFLSWASGPKQQDEWYMLATGDSQRKLLLVVTNMESSLNVETGCGSVTFRGYRALTTPGHFSTKDSPQVRVPFTDVVSFQLTDPTTWAVPWEPGKTFRFAGPLAIVERKVSYGAFDRYTWPSDWNATAPAFAGKSYSYNQELATVCVSSAITNNPEVLAFNPNEWGPLELPHFIDPFRELERFERYYYQDEWDLLPAVFYSSADGVQKHLGVLSANFLESLSELGELAAIVPDLTGLFKAITHAKNLDFVAAGWYLTDLLTSSKLWWEYGISPTSTDIREVVSKIDKIRERFEEISLWGSRTLYGSFSYDLPSERWGPYTSLKLRVRSKLRVYLGYESILAFLLKGKAVGLLPDLSSLWDCVPFSFVADWGFNIGGKLEAVDSALMMASVTLKHAVHSILVTTDLDSDQLSSMGMAAAPGKSSPEIRSFHRYVSLRMPVLKESYYDFQAAHGPTDLLTAGSLVFQLVK